MKKFLIAAFLLLAFSLNAQTPTAVPVPEEPHHHLVFENPFVRVFRVSVPAHDATLLHRHDVPYIYVSLGPADVINAVQGKPEARLVMADGQVAYSPGHFAHIARTDAGSPFNNVTIELLPPQGEPKNLCAQIVNGQVTSPCGITAADKEKDYFIQPQFETAAATLDLVQLRSTAAIFGIVPQGGALFIVLNDSELQVAMVGKPTKTLRGGEVIWLEDGSPETLANPGKNPAKYLRLSFRESGLKP